MSTPFRVLHVFASLDRGGAESMIMNVYRNIDRTKIQFDFVANDDQDQYAFEPEIQALGGRVFRIPRYSVSKHFQYKKAWKTLLSEHPEWKIVHGHHTSPAFAYLPVARKLKRLTIVHGHTAGGDNTMKALLKEISRLPIKYRADYLFACSRAAAIFMFGKKSAETLIINNAIDTEQFIYDHDKRKKARQEFNLSDDQIVVGHVGSFGIPKNHSFLISTFSEIYKKDNQSVLLLVGDGGLRESIEKKVQDLGLSNKVIFTGVRSDIPDLLQAMDIFLFPSLYEGLPVSLIEAQASGLKIFASDTITNEVAITDNIEFMSLNSSADVWAERIMECASGYSRGDMSNEIVQVGYDIKDSAQKLQKFYLEKYQDLDTSI